MKTKSLILAGFCAFCLCTGETQAFNPKQAPINYEVMSLPPLFDRIDLHGLLLTNTSPDDIEAGASDNAVYIHFKRNFGFVSINIINEMGGTVYHTVVNTAVQPTLIIPFSGMNSGSFILSIDNADGYVEGEFEQD